MGWASAQRRSKCYELFGIGQQKVSERIPCNTALAFQGKKGIVARDLQKTTPNLIPLGHPPPSPPPNTWSGGTDAPIIGLGVSKLMMLMTLSWKNGMAARHIQIIEIHCTHEIPFLAQYAREDLYGICPKIFQRSSDSKFMGSVAFGPGQCAASVQML